MSDWNSNTHDQHLQIHLSRAHDLEGKINELRIYRRTQHRALQAAFLSGRLDLPELFLELSTLADAILRSTYLMAKEEISQTFGKPTSFETGDGLSELSLIGMGKLGGRELHFGSDLDLLFIFSKH